MLHVKRLWFVACLGAVALFASCKADDAYPGIIIVSPVSGQTQQAQMVLEVYFSDAEGLEEAFITVTDESDGSVFFEDEPLVKDSTAVLYTKTIPLTNLNEPTPMKLQVDVRDKADQFLLSLVRFTAKK
jgi:hypothetical protein